MQGVDINDKHIEVIVRQMMRKCRVEDAGSTSLITGSLIDKSELMEKNREIRERIAAGEEGLHEATASTLLLGITKLRWLPTAFCQLRLSRRPLVYWPKLPSRVRIDPLLGLKENVIIGKLVPAGTGMNCYSKVEYQSVNAKPLF